MKNNKIKDERVLMEQRKIQSRAYAWIVYILLVSVLVQHFFMNAPFKQYAVEFFLFIGSGIYCIIANYKEGIDIWDSEAGMKKKTIIMAFVGGAAATLVYGILSRGKASEIIVYFFAFAIAFMGFNLMMITINRKRQNSILKELEQDKNEENQ